MRIGVIDLDTSHPEAFLPLLRARGHDVVGIHGGTTVVDDAYTAQYAAEHGIPRVVDDPLDLLDMVDAVFVHGVDWDTHVERARPFAEKDVAVHICKPFAGNAADVRELVSWAANGVRISGGSALRWSAAVADWRGTRRETFAALAATYGHPLDYGIHAYSLLHGLLGPGVEAARALDADARCVELRWPTAGTAVVVVAPPGEGYGFYATVVARDGVHHIEAGRPPELYDRFLGVTTAHLAGTCDQPIRFADLVEPELAAIAGLASAKRDGAWVGLHGDPVIDEVSFDGAAFAAAYRVERRRKLGLSPG